MATRSFAMDRELLRTVRQATQNHARLLYHRLVSRLPHLLAVTFLVVAAQLVPSPPSSAQSSLLAVARTLVHEACANAPVVALACAGLAAAAYAYAASRPRTVYLVDLAVFKPGRAHEATRANTIRHFARAGRFDDESIRFQTRMLERAGVGEATHFPVSLLRVPIEMSLRTAREESEAVVFGVVDDLLAKTGVRANKDVGVVIVNSSLLSPTPSFASLVVNRYGMRPDVVSHNLSGMGCSAGIIAIDLAKRLLQVSTPFSVQPLLAVS
jgi:3-ketoacyl-CoA synthase